MTEINLQSKELQQAVSVKRRKGWTENFIKEELDISIRQVLGYLEAEETSYKVGMQSILNQQAESLIRDPDDVCARAFFATTQINAEKVVEEVKASKKRG